MFIGDHKTYRINQEAIRAMAMRSRTPTSRTKPSPNPVYETFQPKSELKENEEAYFLHIRLPGAYFLFFELKLEILPNIGGVQRLIS